MPNCQLFLVAFSSNSFPKLEKPKYTLLSCSLSSRREIRSPLAMRLDYSDSELFELWITWSVYNSSPDSMELHFELDKYTLNNLFWSIKAAEINKILWDFCVVSNLFNLFKLTCCLLLRILLQPFLDNEWILRRTRDFLIDDKKTCFKAPSLPSETAASTCKG